MDAITLQEIISTFQLFMRSAEGDLAQTAVAILGTAVSCWYAGRLTWKTLRGTGRVTKRAAAGLGRFLYPPSPPPTPLSELCCAVLNVLEGVPDAVSETCVRVGPLTWDDGRSRSSPCVFMGEGNGQVEITPLLTEPERDRVKARIRDNIAEAERRRVQQIADKLASHVVGRSFGNEPAQTRQRMVDPRKTMIANGQELSV